MIARSPERIAATSAYERQQPAGGGIPAVGAVEHQVVVEALEGGELECPPATPETVRSGRRVDADVADVGADDGAGGRGETLEVDRRRRARWARSRTGRLERRHLGHGEHLADPAISSTVEVDAAVRGHRDEVVGRGADGEVRTVGTRG